MYLLILLIIGIILLFILKNKLYSKDSFRINEPFLNKTFLITGSTRGIGFSIAKILSKYNCNIIVTGKDSNTLSKAEPKLKAFVASLHFIQADLSSEEGVNKLFDESIENTKRIDYLINNVTIKSKQKGLSHKKLKDWKNERNVNIDSIFILTQKIIDHMKNKKIEGKIYNISSISSKYKDSRTHSGTDILSKNFIERLTDIYSEENYIYKIGVCTIRIDSGYYKNNEISSNTKNKILKKMYSNANLVNNLFNNNSDNLGPIFINIFKMPFHNMSGKVFSTSAYKQDSKLLTIVSPNNLLMTNIYKNYHLSDKVDDTNIYVNRQNPYNISENIDTFLKNYNYKKTNKNIKNIYKTKLDKIIASEYDINRDEIMFFKNENIALKKIISTFVPKYNSIITMYPYPDNFNIIANECKADIKYTVFNVKNTKIQPKYKYIISYINSKTKLIYLTNPNILTGQCIEKAEFNKFIEQVPDNIVILIDERFIDFVDKKKYINFRKYLDKNIIVLRSFNNFYGYENLELSYIITSNNIIEMLSKTMVNDIQINKFNEELALECINDKKHNTKIVEKIESEKNKMYKRFEEDNIKFFPSDSNYILIEPNKNKKEIVKELKQNNIILENENMYYNSYWSLPISDSKTNEIMLDIICN